MSSQTVAGIVVDASALALALLDTGPAASDWRRRIVTEICHAPHLIDAEVGNLLRRQVIRGQVPAMAAAQLLHASGTLIDHRYETSGRLRQAAWSLRENLSFYDALYVTLAGALAAPLFTTDARLSRAPNLPCTVVLLSSS